MNKQKVSIIIPVYNAAPFISRCVESVLSQTHQNIEVFLVDDGSVDGSGLLCDRFREQDRRIRVAHQPNQGVTAARNTALRLVTGDWIGFVDADDWIEPEMFQLMLDMADTQKADIVCCRAASSKKEPFTYRSYDRLAAMRVLLKDGFLNSLWNKLYRAEILRGIRIPEDIRYAEDLLMNYYAFRRAERVLSLNSGLYHYTRYDDSCTQAQVKELHFDSLKVSKILLEEEQSEELIPFVINRNIRADFAALTRIICGNAFWERYEPIRDDILAHKRDILSGKLQLPTRYKGQLLLLWLCPAVYRFLLKRAKAYIHMKEERTCEIKKTTDSGK